MFHWERAVSEQYREELIRQAERERLAREALSAERRYNPALAWVGRRMMTFGKTLVTMSGEDGQYRPNVSAN